MTARTACESAVPPARRDGDRENTAIERPPRIVSLPSANRFVAARARPTNTTIVVATFRAPATPVVFLAAATLAACASTGTQCPSALRTPPSNAEAHEIFAVLERTPCLGWCPAYKIVVYRDGDVEYEGFRKVKTLGKAKGHLDPLEMDDLAELFEENGYSALDDVYPVSCVDTPSTFTRFSPAGCAPKSASHAGCTYGGPGVRTALQALRRIEDGFDRIVESEQWIGSEDEREAIDERGSHAE